MLILASASPRRHELLLAAGIPHLVRPSRASEERYRDEAADAYVRRVARNKAEKIEVADDDVVLGADTVVCVEGEVLGKPADARDAVRMLCLLSGREHRVLTGIALRKGERSIGDLAETRVWFDEIAPDEMEAYLAREEVSDKAGAYAIQGYASRFVRRIDGCYQNVVGLPVSLVYRHLKAL
jgi:septum formation protein